MEDLAARIVAAIEKDLLDRRGLRQEFRDDIRQEIRETWLKIVNAEISRSY